MDTFANSPSARILATTLVVLLTWFSASWQTVQRKYRRGHQRVLAEISKTLGAFEPYGADNTPLYPKEWANWGQADELEGDPWSRASKFSATVLLGIFASLAIWLPKALAA